MITGNIASPSQKESRYNGGKFGENILPNLEKYDLEVVFKGGTKLVIEGASWSALDRLLAALGTELKERQ